MSTKGPHLHFFPAARVEFLKEVKNHPELLNLIEAEGDVQYHEVVGTVAAHFNILMEGDYTPSDIDRLADKLTLRLQASRSRIILPPTKFLEH